MKKDINYVATFLIFSICSFGQTQGAFGIINDLMIMSKSTLETVFETVDISFNNTMSMLDGYMETMKSSDIEAPVDTIKDTRLMAALTGVSERFTQLFDRVQETSMGVKERTARLQSEISVAHMSLQKLIDELMPHVGHCSMRSLISVLSKIHACASDCVETVRTELHDSKLVLNEIMRDCEDLAKKRRESLLKLDPAPSLNDIMRSDLPAMFRTANEKLMKVMKLLPIVEPLRICITEAENEAARICKIV